MSNKELKEKYDKTFKLIKRIINNWDPIGLLPSAPDDEYEMEIGRIVSLLNKAESVNVFAGGISSTFNKYFDVNITDEECLPVAQKIWEAVEK